MSEGWTVLKRAENELLTQVGPGTAMGVVMRRYWIPVLLREEVPDPDGDPVRVADGFRRIDTTGHTILPGLVDAHAHIAAVMCGAELQTPSSPATSRTCSWSAAIRSAASRPPVRSRWSSNQAGSSTRKNPSLPPPGF